MGQKKGRKRGIEEERKEQEKGREECDMFSIIVPKGQLQITSTHFGAYCLLIHRKLG